MSSAEMQVLKRELKSLEILTLKLQEHESSHKITNNVNEEDKNNENKQNGHTHQHSHNHSVEE